jgi:hypothetical protein
MSKSTLVTPIISSAYGITLERRMLDKILFEADSKGMALLDNYYSQL